MSIQYELMFLFFFLVGQEIKSRILVSSECPNLMSAFVVLRDFEHRPLI